MREKDIEFVKEIERGGEKIKRKLWNVREKNIDIC
jgi:hypothetical protein